MIKWLASSISRKIGFSVMLFAVPAVFTAVVLVNTQNKNIAFSAKEIQGVAYLQAVVGAQLDVARQQLGMPVDLASHVSKLQNIQQIRGAGLDSEKLSGAAVDGIIAISSKPNDNEIGTTARQALAALNLQVGNQSNLILDPDLDSFYEMDLVVVKLPDIIDRITNFALLSEKTVRDGYVDEGEKLELLVAHSGLKTVLDGAASSLDSAYSGNKDGSVKAALADSFSVFEKDVINETASWSTQSPSKQSAQGALLASQDFYNKISKDLLRLITVRVDGFTLEQKFILSVTVVLFFVLFGGTLLVVNRHIIAALKRITETTNFLSHGNLDAQIPFVKRHDEIGEIARSLKIFQENLIETERLRQEELRTAQENERKRIAYDKLFKEFESTISKVSSSVSDSAEHMRSYAVTLDVTARDTHTQSTQVAVSSEQAASNVATVAAATEELTASIHEITRQVTDSSRIAADAVGEAREANSSISSLNAAAERIGEVVKLIFEIAEQTNLLALNATIEAARAGEAGKGFAVVASEVKNLASQTAKATDEISQQITSMQSVVEVAVRSIHGMANTIEHISSGSTTIAAAVEEQGAATAEISRNVQEAATGTQIVSHNIASVTQGASETGRVAHDVLDAASSLAQESTRLKDEVESFILRMRSA